MNLRKKPKGNLKMKMRMKTKVKTRNLRLWLAKQARALQAALLQTLTHAEWQLKSLICDTSDRLIEPTGPQAAISDERVFGTTPTHLDEHQKIDLQFAAPLIIVQLMKVMKMKMTKNLHVSKVLKRVKRLLRTRKFADSLLKR